MKSFVHLRARSAYSLLEGAIQQKQLIELASKYEMPALAVADTNNLFGALEFAVKCSGSGIQPIIGCTMKVSFEKADEDKKENKLNSISSCLVLIAKDEVGYQNLMKLSSIAFLEHSFESETCIPFDVLIENQDGLMVLTGGKDGPIGSELLRNRSKEAEAILLKLKDVFSDRLYIELQRHGFEDEEAIEQDLLSLAYENEIPIVATNNCLFASRDYFNAHDALLAVAQGTTVSDENRTQLTAEHYFKSTEEMVELFSDLPEAIENTLEIAQRCSYWPKPIDPILPQFTITENEDPLAAEEAELAKQSQEGLRARLEAHGCATGMTEEDYFERLEFELNVIKKMRYPGYFLIVSDFIKWAKSQDIPVGPGRGSGAASVVAWSLSITDLDPLRFALLFERFLNPERVSMPDFDIDFCQERRDEVISYVQQRYGQDRVAQIITFGTLQSRGVLRDVGRVLQMSYGEVDGLAKLVPADPANPVKLKDAIEGEPKLQEARDSSPTVARLLEYSQKLEGLNRHASTHAAGIVIGDRPLDQLVPLYQDPRSTMPSTQFNMKWVEQAGLVKFDFLGLKTLTIIEHTLKLLRKRDINIDISTIPLDDTATYEMMSKGDTTGVFQLESAGMRDALGRMQPDRFEDIIALVALYRPGPMDNIPTYCHRKHGREKPDYMHPMLQPILEETYGVIIYQEQVMQIAQVLSGYSLGEADLLRRAMGKKIKSEMDLQRGRFEEGASEKGVDKKQASHIFDLVAKFADYGFNKAHAAAYALIAYQTAYLKSKYPVEFLAASMTLDMGNTDKLNDFRQEAQRLDIEVLKPSINHSDVNFLPEEGNIRYSMAAIKNVGRQVVSSITEERNEKGKFESISEFSNRINAKMLNRRAVEQMACAGVFDDLEPNRERVRAGADLILGAANSSTQSREIGQSDMFSCTNGGSTDNLILPNVPYLSEEKRLNSELGALGLYLSGHPLDEYMPQLKKKSFITWQEFKNLVERGHSAGKLAGSVAYVKVKRNRNGGKFAFLGLSDPSGQYEVMVFADQLNLYNELLVPGALLVLILEADQRGDGDMRLRVQSITSAMQHVEQNTSGIKVFLDRPFQLSSLSGLLREGKGNIRLVVDNDQSGTEVEIELPGRYAVSPEIASAFKAMGGVKNVLEL